MLSILFFSAVTEITAGTVAREIVPTVIAAPAGAHEPSIALPVNASNLESHSDEQGIQNF